MSARNVTKEILSWLDADGNWTTEEMFDHIEELIDHGVNFHPDQLGRDRSAVIHWFHITVIEPDGHKCSGCTVPGEPYQCSWKKFRHKTSCPTQKDIGEMVRVLLCQWDKQRSKLREKIKHLEEWVDEYAEGRDYHKGE